MTHAQIYKDMESKVNEILNQDVNTVLNKEILVTEWDLFNDEDLTKNIIIMDINRIVDDEDCLEPYKEMYYNEKLSDEDMDVYTSVYIYRENDDIYYVAYDTLVVNR